MEEIAFELMPQGTLAEAIRAGGAGIGGFYTQTAVGTVLADNAESKLIDGRPHIFVRALRADVALIRARYADRAGNLVYRMTEQNFNKAMATAADLVIAEVEEILPVGALDPGSYSYQRQLCRLSGGSADDSGRFGLIGGYSRGQKPERPDSAGDRAAGIGGVRSWRCGQSRCWHPHLDCRSDHAGARDYSAYGEWHVGRGTSARGRWRLGLPSQCRQDTGYRFAGQQLF